ncbi:MAG: glycosyltransferase [Actinobacteria bacterium]|nr:glycosyltransferase [Actinomycetota bacterium]
MKILYLITQSELGGAQCYVFDLASGIRDDFDITVAFGEQGEAGELAKKLKQENIPYYAISSLKRAISPFNDFLALIEIVKLIKKLKPDIIHLNSSKISILGSIAGYISKLQTTNYKLQTTYTVHGWVFNEPMPRAKKLFYKYAEKFTAIFKNKIICVSKLDYDIAKNQLKINEKKLTLIHHGIKPINFLPREHARHKLLPNYKPQTTSYKLIIGTIANLYKTKGLEYLIEAVKILITNYQLRITVIIIGEGGERKNLEKLIKNYNLQDNILLAGKIKNAADLLPAFDIYASSSVKEGFPYTILEAMSAGVPIVSTNVGGIPEMIINGENGLLVNPRNPEELAQKIKSLIKNETLKSALSEQAKNDAKEKFGIEKMIKKTKEIYSPTSPR